MNNIDLIILNKSGRINPLIPIIQQAFDEVVQKVCERIPTLTDIDIVCADSPHMVIPETGIVGYTHTKHFIAVHIDPNFPSAEQTLAREIKSTIAHELHHCARMGSVSSYGNLVESLITEGLADHFDIEINGTKPKPWSVAVQKEDLEPLLERARQEFMNPSYNHNAWFFGSQELSIPRWAGYTIGFNLVQEYMNKTGKKPSELFNTTATEIAH